MLTAAFTGSPDPFCQPLGSCGEHGTLTEQLSAADHTLSFYGARIVKRRVSSRKVLADLRAGRFRLENGMPSALRGTLSETIGAPGAAACTDRVGVSGLVISARSQGAMDRFGILTSDQSGDGSSSTADPFRTHCQGPMSTDLDRGGVMALARVPIDSLLGPG